MEAYFSGKKDLFNGLKISELEEEGPTGVTKFSHVSIFSDLNQLKDISMMPDYNEICGLTMDEIAENFYPEISDLASEDGLTVEEEKKKLAEWYDGYLFADEGKGIFNPFSVLNVLADKKYKNYWFGTGTPTFLIRTLKRTGYDIRLLEKGTEQKAEAFTNYFADSNSPIPLFYQSGYLIQMDLSDVKEAVRLLGITSSNMNQYAKKANETGSIYKEDIDDIRLHQEELWKVMKEILKRLSTI